MYNDMSWMRRRNAAMMDAHAKASFASKVYRRMQLRTDLAEATLES